MHRTCFRSLCCLALVAAFTAVAASAEDEKAGKAAPPEEPPLSNTLRWTTASEIDNFGFDVYRGMTEEGPWERITAEPIAGAGTTDVATDYVFVDEEIDPAKDHYYWIESISMEGVREAFTPVIRAAAKRPGGEKQADDATRP